MTKLVFIANSTSAVTETIYDGKPYLIAPVVMIREGVHNALLYLTEELGAFVESWNGRAIPISHPQRAGEYVSANSPDIWASEVVGFLFNTRMDGDRLVSEIWLDIEKAEKLGELGAGIVETLRSGGQMEVSTGLLLNIEETPGSWNGESYDGIARMIYPDHLALLPNEIGACSWDDGCGTPRVNTKGEGMKDEVTTNELTLDDKATLVRRAFWDQVYTAEQASPIYGDWDVVSVFDTTLIAKNWDKKAHMAFPYTLNESGDVVFGDAVAVEVVYRATEGGAEVVVANATDATAKQGLFNRFRRWLAAGQVEGLRAGEQPASEQQEAEGMKKCDMVAALVANERCKVSEAALQQMDEATLIALHEVYTANAESAPATPVANAQAVDVKALVAETVAATTAAVKAEFAPMLATITANANRERAELVAEIVANSQMAADDLTPMSVEALRNLASSLLPRDYSGGAGTFRSNNDEDGEYVMEMPLPKGWAVAGEGQ